MCLIARREFGKWSLVVYSRSEQLMRRCSCEISCLQQISCHTFVKDIFDTSMDIFDTSLNIFGKCILIFNKSMYIFVTSINILENYWTITKNILFYVKIKPKIKKISTSRVLEFFPLSYSMFFSHFFSCNTVPLTDSFHQIKFSNRKKGIGKKVDKETFLRY